MADKYIPVLRVFDDEGNEYPIPAIQGRKGDKGDPGEGDMKTSVYDPQGIGEDVFARIDEADNVFVAAYGETPYADVAAAYTAGKAMFLMRNKAVYPFFRKQTNYYCFVNRTADSKVLYYCAADNTWAEQFVSDLPVAHAERHGKDGDDPITLESIGAVEKIHAAQHGKDGTDPITPEAIGAGRIATSTYIGNGEDSRTIPFPGGIPEVVFVRGGGTHATLFPNGGGGFYYTANISGTNVTSVTVSTSGTNVIVSGVNAVNLNSKNTTYRYTGIG